MNEARPRWKQVVDSWNQGFADLARNIGKALQRCGEINGEVCAASFAYYAFFSLFPLILLMAAIGTFFIPDRYQAARQVVQEVEQYVPLQAKDRELLFTIMDDAIKNGWRAWDFWALGAALGRSTLFSGAGLRRALPAATGPGAATAGLRGQRPRAAPRRVAARGDRGGERHPGGALPGRAALRAH